MAQVRIALGGKRIYGACLGILMLEARFPRIPGDMGNAETWPFPVLYKIVSGASPDRVVRKRADGLLPNFITAAKELVSLGADGITTNCGFMALYQNELASQVNVPVATSSLQQIPLVLRLLPPGRRVGIITISKETLTSDHLKAIGVDPDIPVVGTEGAREFSRVILDDEDRLDVAAAEQDIIDAGTMLLTNNPDIGAVVLECTNMVPYARALRRHLGIPVFDIYSFVTWFHAGLIPRSFGHPGEAITPWRG